MKKRSFNREGEEPDEPVPGPPQGAPKKHKNFHIDLECMRLNAEKDRIQHYKDLAVSSAIQYYKVLRRILEEAIEQKSIIHYATDYMKAVIENGNFFTAANLFFLLDNLHKSDMNEEFIEVLRYIFEELHIEPNEMHRYLADLTQKQEFAKRDYLSRIFD